MTDQYQQENINLLDGDPVTFSTQGVTPLAVTIDQLTVDGEALMVQMFGGGVDPSSVLANNYTCLFRVMYTRAAGVVSATSVRDNIVSTGSLVGIAAVGVGDECRFTLTTGLASPYLHRWKVSKIRF